MTPFTIKRKELVLMNVHKCLVIKNDNRRCFISTIGFCFGYFGFDKSQIIKIIKKDNRPASQS